MKRFCALTISLILTAVFMLPFSADKTDYLKWTKTPSSDNAAVEYLSDGYLIFTKNGKQGIMSYDGTVCIEASYGSIKGVYAGILQTTSPDGYIKVNDNYEITEEEVTTEGLSSEIVVYDDTDGTALLAEFDLDGNFLDYSAADDELFPCIVRKADIEQLEGATTISVADSYGYALSAEELKYDLSYEAAMQFDNGIFALRKNGAWAYFFSDGTELTAFAYSDTYTYVDSLGDTVNGVYAPSDGVIACKKRSNYGFISAKNGSPVVPFVYDNILPSFDNISWVCVDGLWGCSDVSDIPSQITSITISGFTESVSTVRKGTKLHLSYTVVPEGSDSMPLVWSSSDESIASVEDGVVTAVGTGDVTVSAYNIFGDFVGSYTFSIADSDNSGVDDGLSSSGTTQEQSSQELSPTQQVDDDRDPIMTYSIAIGCAAMVVAAIVLIFTTRNRLKRDAAKKRAHASDNSERTGRGNA